MVNSRIECVGWGEMGRKVHDATTTSIIIMLTNKKGNFLTLHVWYQALVISRSSMLILTNCIRLSSSLCAVSSHEQIKS